MQVFTALMSSLQQNAEQLMGFVKEVHKANCDLVEACVRDVSLNK